MNTKTLIGILIVVIVLIVVGVIYNMNEETSTAKKVLLKTTMGDVVIELYPEMSITTGNFEKLINGGICGGVI